MTDLLIPARYNGPPSSGNGGWSAGALALAAGLGVGSTATVQLRMPPPLEVPLPLVEADGWTAATREQATVLRVRPAGGDLTPVTPVTTAVARAASPSYAGHRSHPFPTCFACGNGREAADGLAIFPGRVPDDRADGADDGADGAGAVRVATTWTPAGVDVPSVWAALDCIGGWAGDLEERLIVLGTMTLRLDRLPTAGVEHVVMGGARGVEGRKTFSASSLYDPAGDLLATAEHVWIAVDPAMFG